LCRVRVGVLGIATHLLPLLRSSVPPPGNLAPESWKKQAEQLLEGRTEEASGTPAGEVELRPGKATASGWGLVAWVASVRGCGIDPSPSFADKRNARSVPFSCLLLRVLSSLGGRGSKLPAGSRGMATASRFQDGTSPGHRGGFHRMSTSRRGEFRGRQQQPAGYDNGPVRFSFPGLFWLISSHMILLNQPKSAGF